MPGLLQTLSLRKESQAASLERLLGPAWPLPPWACRPRLPRTLSSPHPRYPRLARVAKQASSIMLRSPSQRAPIWLPCNGRRHNHCLEGSSRQFMRRARFSVRGCVRNRLLAVHQRPAIPAGIRSHHTTQCCSSTAQVH